MKSPILVRYSRAQLSGAPSRVSFIRNSQQIAVADVTPESDLPAVAPRLGGGISFEAHRPDHCDDSQMAEIFNAISAT